MVKRVVAGLAFLTAILVLVLAQGLSTAGSRQQAPLEAGDAGALGAAAVATGEREMRALALAYPDRIAELAFKDGDWALRMDDTWYYWAQGRLLTAEDREQWEDFSGLRFYNYSHGIPPLRKLDEETKQRLKERLDEQARRPPDRSEKFLEHLYQAKTQQEMEQRVVRMQFLGLTVRVHQMIAGRLTAVEQRLNALKQTNAEVRSFMAGLRQASGYYWRDIAGTASRSYHAYAVAVDLIPRSYGGKQFYWRNLLPFDDAWYELPYERRWMAPLAFVEAFEAEGFIWGGKWLYFDTVHFEYRPELLILRDEAS